jgi:hypothetical protein
MAQGPTPISLKEWLAILDCYLERMHKPGKTDKQVTRIDDRFAQRTNDVLRKPVRSFDDLVVLAAVAAHWNAPTDADDPPYPQCVIDGDPSRSFDQRALAYLVKGILELARLRARDNEGRLLQLS